MKNKTTQFKNDMNKQENWTFQYTNEIPKTKKERRGVQKVTNRCRSNHRYEEAIWNQQGFWYQQEDVVVCIDCRMIWKRSFCCCNHCTPNHLLFLPPFFFFFFFFLISLSYSSGNETITRGKRILVLEQGKQMKNLFVFVYMKMKNVLTQPNVSFFIRSFLFIIALIIYLSCLISTVSHETILCVLWFKLLIFHFPFLKCVSHFKNYQHNPFIFPPKK